MAFIVADIQATLPGPSTDRGVRVLRDTTPPTTGDGRRGFSSVLRSVRSEAWKSANREAEGGRSAAKSDGDSHDKEPTVGTSSTHPVNPQTSSQTTDRTTSTSSDDTRDDDTKAGLDPSTQQRDVAPEHQEQGSVVSPVLIAVPTQPEASDQTSEETKTGSHVIADENDVGTGSQHSLVSKESSQPLGVRSEITGNRPSTTPGDVAPHLLSAQPLNQTATQQNDGARVPQGTERGTEVDDHEAVVVATDHGGPLAIPQGSVPSVPSSPQDQANLQGHEVHVAMTALEGKSLVVQDKTLRQEGRLPDHSVPSDAHQYGQALSRNDALGANMEQTFPQGRQSSHEGFEQLDKLWADHNGHPMEHGDPTISQTFSLDHTIAGGSPAELAASGASRQGSAAPATHPSATVVSQVQSGTRAEDMVQTTGGPVNRSVVVHVAQPDLGQVNIRVAMTNEIVHTHVSSERPEVGQFLINSQDRLQAALQASGLDMGQFRVDIDRQGGGRSFQQGLFQEQGRSWSQGSPDMRQDTQHEKQDGTGRLLDGLLNLVA